MSFEAFLALQYLKPKRRRGFINMISIISVAGVAVSVAALIVVISVMNGFDNDIRDKIIGTNSHVLVNAYSKAGIPDYQGLTRRIEALGGVEAAAPFYQGQAMVKSDNGVIGVVVQGIDPVAQSRIAKLKQDITAGHLDDLKEATGDEAPAVFLGSELADNLGADIGTELTLFSPVFRMTPAGMMPRMAKLRVAGKFETGYYEYDSNLMYMSLADAQKIFDAPGTVNQIGVRVKDLNEAPDIADEIQGMDNGLNFWAKDWMSMNQNLFKALKTEKMIMFLILGCMVVVAAFNIVSTLVMLVMEKTKEIGVLRSLGAKERSILRIFIYEGLIIGVLGGALGFAIGLAVCAFISIHPIHIPGGGSIYYIDNLPVSVQGRDLIIIGILSVATCFVAALYPAWQASRLDPVEAIRYE